MTVPSARKAIRAAFKTRLLGQTRAQARVFTSRFAPINPDDPQDLPAILIYGREEKDYEHAVENEDTWKRRNLYVVTEAMMRAGDDVDDKLDDFAAEFETLIDDWVIPGFESADVRLFHTEIDITTESFKFPVGVVGLTWHVAYRTPWRVRPDIVRPDTVYSFLNDEHHTPELLIEHDKGVINQPPTPVVKP